jgi:Tfp pilus assembly protein PilN
VIKINLAKRRMMMMAAESGKPADQVAGVLSRLNLEQFKELPIQKFAVPAAIALAASLALDSYKEDQMKKIMGQINKAKEDTKNLQSKVAGYKTYDTLKKALDEDELLIKTKLDTIHTLIANRSDPPKLLRGIAASIPRDAWLTDLKVQDADVSIKGESYGFGQISDFMKILTDHPLVGKVELKASKQVKDKDYGEIAGFELSLKRRSGEPGADQRTSK